MNKIFDLDFRKGSLIEDISGEKGSLTAGDGKFHHTKKGLGLYCDGSSTKLDTLLAHADIDLTGDLTLEVWYRLDNIGGVARRIIENGQFRLYVLDANDNWNFTSDASTQVNSAVNSIKLGVWQHLIITRASDGTTNFYLDTSLSGSADQDSGTPVDGDTNVIIGNRNAGDRGFKGVIMNVAVYDEILDMNSINEKYQEFLHSFPMPVMKENINAFFLNKPDDLSNENGLVAAYNMKPNGSTLVDISGSGNNGTITGAISTVKGMKFDGVDDEVSMGVVTFLDGLTTATWCLRFKTTDVSASLFSQTYNNLTFYINLDASGKLLGRTTGATLITSTNSYNDGKIHNAVLVLNGTSLILYVDGVNVGSTNDAEAVASSSDDHLSLGVSRDNGGSSSNADCEIYDAKIYNRAWTEQEAKDYYNEFASRTYLRETFEGNGADEVAKLPKGWIPGTGSFKIGELASQDSVLKDLKRGTKYLECTSVGDIHHSSTQAVGTWLIGLYKKGAGTSCHFQLVENVHKDWQDSSFNGYILSITSTEKIILGKITGGSYSEIMGSAAAYVENEKNYEIKVTRTTAGVFTIYARGGSLGANWVQVPASTGSNPVTDNTYMTTVGLGFSPDSIGDILNGFEVLQGIEQ